MRLKKLTLHGFKSFAEHVEINFEDAGRKRLMLRAAAKLMKKL